MLPTLLHFAPRASPLLTPKTLSNELRDFMGVASAPRTEVVKQLWKYIKANNLQNPMDKRQIINDDTMM